MVRDDLPVSPLTSFMGVSPLIRPAARATFSLKGRRKEIQMRHFAAAASLAVLAFAASSARLKSALPSNAA